MADYAKPKADVLVTEQWPLRSLSSSTQPPRGFLGLRRNRFVQGWRKGVATGAFTAAFTLVVNVLATIVFAARYGNNGGFVTLFTGACDQASRVNFGIHLVINVLGSLLLASSNYCMQVLTAPTRSEVDAAHSRGKWLDIGLQSVRNLTGISRWRLWVWLLLVASSLPLHLVYNSVVFSTVHAFEYTAVLASPGFVGGPTYDGPLNIWTSNEVIGNEPTLADVQEIQADATQYQRLENAECIDEYRKALVTNRSDLVLITMFHNTSDEQSKVFATYRDGDFYVDFDGIASWMSESLNESQLENGFEIGDTPDPLDWYLETWRIDHCLSRPESELCTVRSSIDLTIVVVVCNALKLVALLVTLFVHKSEPLVTIGDAIESFVAVPDLETTNACLLSRADVKSGQFSREPHHVKAFKSKRVFRFQAVSGARWWISLFLCLAGVAVVAVFLDLSIIGVDQSGILPSSANDNVTLGQLWNMGFGLGDGSSFWQNAPSSLYGNILLANLPQLIFSMLYFVYNGLYTVMSLAAEWASFATRRKALRVSRPAGAQRSTYYLQLPYAYALPLIIASAAMHWLISQSFFVLAVDFSGSSTSENLSYVTCGYSPIAIIFALALAVLMIAIIFLNGFRRIGFTMPLVGSCSLAISAACHAPPDGADPTAPLQWGVVAEGEVGHCAFSCDHVKPPVVGARYAGHPFCSWI